MRPVGKELMAWALLLRHKAPLMMRAVTFASLGRSLKSNLISRLASLYIRASPTPGSG